MGVFECVSFPTPPLSFSTPTPSFSTHTFYFSTPPPSFPTPNSFFSTIPPSFSTPVFIKPIQPALPPTHPHGPCCLAQAAKPTERHWHSLPSPPAEQHVLRHKSARQSCAHIPLGKGMSWVAAPAFFLRTWPSSVSNACHHVPLKTTEQQNSPEPAAPAQNLRPNPDFPCA